MEDKKVKNNESNDSIISEQLAVENAKQKHNLIVESENDTKSAVEESVAEKTLIEGNKQKEDKASVVKSAQKKKVSKERKLPTFRLYRFLRLLISPILRFLFPTKIVNRENFDKIEGGVIICNHYSVPDTLIPAVKLFKRELHVMAKAEAFATPIGNKLLRSVGAIPVHRGEPDIGAVREVMAVLRANKKFMIFPEGTRNRQGTQQMAQFKQGAARFAIKSKKPVLPMMYYRNHKLFRKNYLYIGEPIYFDDFYGAKTPNDYQNATDLVQAKMDEVRVLVNAYVESKKKKK